MVDKEKLRQTLHSLKGLMECFRREQPNINEADTIYQLIDVLLLDGLDYQRRNIKRENLMDLSGKNYKPDFVLEDSADMVILLEAKQLNKKLDDDAELQLITYALALPKKSRRPWAILSNGNEYRLYDAYAAGSNKERQRITVSITDFDDSEEMLKNFALFSHYSLMGGISEKFFKDCEEHKRKVAKELDLKPDKSPQHKLLLDDHIRLKQPMTEDIRTKIFKVPKEDVVNLERKSLHSHSSGSSDSDELKPFGAFKGQKLRYRQIQKLLINDKEKFPTSWKDMCTIVMKFLYELDKDHEFFNNKTYFGTSEQELLERFKAYQDVRNPIRNIGRDLYFNAHGSSEELYKRAYEGLEVFNCLSQVKLCLTKEKEHK